MKKHLAVALDGCDQHDTVFTYDVQVGGRGGGARLYVSATSFLFFSSPPPPPEFSLFALASFDVVPPVLASFQVPVGSVARVNMPLMGVAAADAVIYESSKPVFNKGKYVSGVAGVTGASVDGNEIVISVSGVPEQKAKELRHGRPPTRLSPDEDYKDSHRCASPPGCPDWQRPLLVHAVQVDLSSKHALHEPLLFCTWQARPPPLHAPFPPLSLIKQPPCLSPLAAHSPPLLVKVSRAEKFICSMPHPPFDKRRIKKTSSNGGKKKSGWLAGWLPRRMAAEMATTFPSGSGR